MTRSDPFVHDDAAYVLGALSSDERAAFEAHLAGCAECQARVAEVRGVPALLAGLSAADLGVDDTSPVPDTLLPGLLRRAGAHRRRQRALFAGVAAVAVACLVGLVIAVWPSPSSGPGTSPTSPAVAVAQDFVPLSDVPVRANASLISTSWGTRIDVHCSYTEGVSQPFPYALRVIDDQGDADPLGSWVVPVGHDIAYQAGTRYSQDEISKVEITKLDGTPLLELTVN